MRLRKKYEGLLFCEFCVLQFVSEYIL